MLTDYPLLKAFSNWQFSFKGLVDNRRGEWLLISQLIIIFAHFLPTYPSHSTLGLTWPMIFIIIGIIFIFIGGILSIKALLHLGASLSPLPDPKPKAALIQSGLYSKYRHPLYQGLLVGSIGIVFTLGSLLHFLLFTILCLNLKSKAVREESKLRKKYPEYESYIKNTPAIFKGLIFFDWRS